MPASRRLHSIQALRQPSNRGVGPEILLLVHGLRKAFGGQVVLDEVSLQLRRGELVLLRGDNGVGKTTLLNLLTGNMTPDAGSLQLFTNGVEETFYFPRRRWQNFNPWDHFSPERLASERVGRTWQDIRLFATQTLAENIAVATPDQIGENPLWSLLRHVSVAAQERRVQRHSAELLAQFGLQGREESSADKISLGQSKRVAIARAVQAGAQVLFLDEPLAGLDANGIVEVMSLIEELARNRRLTLVIVEHVLHIPRILELATTVWTLEAGRVTVESPAAVLDSLRRSSANCYLEGIRETAGSADQIAEEALPAGAYLTKFGRPGEVLLEVNDLVAHRGRRLVIGWPDSSGTVQGLSFSLNRGQLAVLQAPNGWGKTTLLEVLVGLLPPSRGAVLFRKQPIHKLPAWERARLGLSLLQARNQSFPGLTVREVVRLSHDPKVCSLGAWMDKNVSNLSGGEKQRLALACVLHSSASGVKMLDEPFSGLDGPTIERMHGLLTQLLSRNGLLIAVPRRLEDAPAVG